MKNPWADTTAIGASGSLPLALDLGTAKSTNASPGSPTRTDRELAAHLGVFKPARSFPKINIKRLIRSAEPKISKMAEKTPLYTLPVPSTELDGEPRLCGETLQFQYQRDGIRVRGGIRFEHVAATRTRVERNSTVWHVEGAYDTLVEIVPSAWAEEIRAATQTRWRDYWELHHYLIYVDSAGSFEVLADSFKVLPEEVGSWPQD